MWRYSSFLGGTRVRHCPMFFSAHHTTCAASNCSPSSSTARFSVSQQLLRPALLLRWQLLSLHFDGESNMCCLAEGDLEGLPHGTRLEMFGPTVQLVRQRPLGVGVAADAGVVRDVTEAIESALSYSSRGSHKKTIVVALPSPLSSSLSTGTPLSEGANDVEVIARWTLVKQEEEEVGNKLCSSCGDDGYCKDSLPLMENGIVFPSPQLAGLRALRASRQLFSLLLGKEIQENVKDGVTGRTGPIAVLDVSEVDCSFCRVAAHMAIERGLTLEKDLHITYVPFSSPAAASADESIASIIHMVGDPSCASASDPFQSLQARYYNLVSCTLYSGMCGGRKGGGNARGNKVSGCARLAGVISKIRCGGALLVNLVGNGRMCRDIAREAKTLLTEALSRSGRWGAVIDEVYPAADVHDAVVSFVVIVD